MPLQSFRDEAALANELGFDATFVDDVPFVGGPGVRFSDQARFHPRKYLAGARAGDHRPRRNDLRALRRRTSSATIRARSRRTATRSRATAIVLATHNPLVGNAGMVSATLFQTKLALYTSYVIGGRVKKG